MQRAIPCPLHPHQAFAPNIDTTAAADSARESRRFTGRSGRVRDRTRTGDSLSELAGHVNFLDHKRGGKITVRQAPGRGSHSPLSEALLANKADLIRVR